VHARFKILPAHRAQALLWRQLTTIALDAPLQEATVFPRGTGDAAHLLALCESLRFGPLTRRRLHAAGGVQTADTFAG